MCVCAGKLNPEQSLIWVLYLSEQEAVGQKNKVIADQNMSVPVANEGDLVVVTQIQPVTMPALLGVNHAFSKGHPLSLGVSQ